jgi:catechol 2,3-dioxygenase-like lactoylglutathione lyase family enzyme
MAVIRHIALHVPDLRAAETYYEELFAMELIGREAPVSSTEWATLPFDKTWDDADAAGVEIGMVALRSGAFTLALFPGSPQAGTLFAIGLTVSPDELAAIRQRLPEDAPVVESDERSITFFDQHGFAWQLATGHAFSTAGVFADRWLDV